MILAQSPQILYTTIKGFTLINSSFSPFISRSLIKYFSGLLCRSPYIDLSKNIIILINWYNIIRFIFATACPRRSQRSPRLRRKIPWDKLESKSLFSILVSANQAINSPKVHHSSFSLKGLRRSFRTKTSPLQSQIHN